MKINNKKEFKDLSKINYSVTRFIDKIHNPIILEFGVQLGSSTKYFLDFCKKKNGKLYSVDVNDCSKLFNDPNWKFIRARDDDFDHILKNIPSQVDVIYLDTIHTAKHVKKIFNYYYPYLKNNGFFIIDDVSWLPYLKKNEFDNFYCEINNKETFDNLLNIFDKNSKNFEITFFFKDTGTAVIEKLNNNELSNDRKIRSREFSIKNFFRKLVKKL